MELASVMTYLMDGQMKNRQVVEQKLNSHLDKVKTIFEAYEKRAREKLTEAYKKQDGQMRKAE